MRRNITLLTLPGSLAASLMVVCGDENSQTAPMAPSAMEEARRACKRITALQVEH